MISLPRLPKTLLFSLIIFTLSACPADPGESPIADTQSLEGDARPATEMGGGSDFLGHDLLGNDDGAVIPGDPTVLLLRGAVVTPAGIIDPGEVLIDKDNIVCVAASCAGETQAKGATLVTTGGIIFPGLIDSHNHTQYNYLPVWKHSKLFSNHNQWQGNAEYKTFIDPHRTLDNTLMCEMVKYGEIRSLIAGTTMIQGTPNRKCSNTLIRNADLRYHGFGDVDTIRTNVLGIGNVDPADAQKLRDEFTSGKTQAYVLHLGEGIDETARKEFDKLEALGLLLPQVVIIHGTALGMPEFTKMKAAKMPLIWSPSSNLDLYGGTNDIATVKALGIHMSLAPDWTPSGAPNILDELRVAHKYDTEHLGTTFTAKDLFEMVTIKPAEALGFDKEIGTLEVGKRADVLVLRGDAKKPYEALLAAHLTDVRLVIVAGKALYGDPSFLTGLAPNAYCESVTICKAAKMLCVKESESADNLLNESFTDIETKLAAGYPKILSLSTGCP